jgi:hypothetical protein
MNAEKMQGASKASAENGSTVSPMVMKAAIHVANALSYPWESMPAKEREELVSVITNALTECGALECLEALKKLLRRDQRNTCQHESTHRGGFLWEICDDCGAKWADDEGGKPGWIDPPEWTAAESAIAKARDVSSAGVVYGSAPE